MSEEIVRLTPPPNAEGFYEVREPFTNYVIADHVYRCIAVRTFQDMADLKRDAQALAYTKYGLGEEVYLADLAAGAMIITLTDLTESTNENIYISDAYIISYPNMDIANYSRIIASVDLGALPSGIELGYFITLMQEGAKNVIGVSDATINVHKGATSGLMSIDKHSTLLATRIANKKQNPTLQEQVDKLTSDNLAIKNSNKILIEYIKALEQKINNME